MYQSMHRQIAALVCAAILSFHSPQTSAAVVGPVTLAIPEGYNPMQTQRNGKTLISAWTKSARDKRTKALLQVSVYDYAAKLANATPVQQQAASEKYLLQYLGEIERRRASYTQSPVIHAELAGAAAAHATWNGKLGTIDVVGIMYCVVLNSRYVVSLHTQDLGTQPTSAMLEAVSAIKALQFTPQL